MGGGEGRFNKEGIICIFITDSRHCIAETNNIVKQLSSN